MLLPFFNWQLLQPCSSAVPWSTILSCAGTVRRTHLRCIQHSLGALGNFSGIRAHSPPCPREAPASPMDSSDCTCCCIAGTESKMPCVPNQGQAAWGWRLGCILMVGHIPPPLAGKPPAPPRPVPPSCMMTSLPAPIILGSVQNSMMILQNTSSEVKKNVCMLLML